ncbi:MAG: diguanylate cyclase [Helicobacteraceae bacterium]|nr:diguanylate cyclase [Helicobacteraceae bacterium]
MLLRKGVNIGANGDAVAEPIAAATASGAGEVENFARAVLDELAKDNLPPLPNYYQLYFEKALDEKPYEFRKAMSDMIEGESSSEDEKRMLMERQLQEGFGIFKEILQNVATLFKSVSNMTQISKRRMQEAKAINNPSAVQNLSLALNNDLEKLTLALNSQAIVIKNLYTKSAKIIQEVKGETIYDSQYGIFNKRYLTEQVRAEIAHIEKFNHHSTLMLAKLSRNVKERVGSEKQLGLINRTISKLFMKTSRRSDIVAHFGEGCFGILLKHTDEQNAARAALRVAEMTSGSHFFIADQEIKLEVRIGVATLSVSQEAETVMVRALDAMNKADEEGAVYEIAPLDEGEKTDE